ncbi:MAG: ComF family protein [Muribaculaceae bacterium]|nr:ComF family protein [Muribaculaceae bacterium]
MIKRWLKDILNLVYPAECHLCGNALSPSERFICNPCIETLPRTGYHRHLRNPMEERFAGHFPFVAATGHFFYSRDSSLAQLIQDMKYRNFPSIGDKLGEIAGKELYISGFLNDIDVIVPVPMHFIKRSKRGYNQVDHIAEGISKATGIEVENALKMTRQRKTQTSLSRTERLTNAESLFCARKNINLNGRGVLLVDDICTTGATLGAAANAVTDSFPETRLYLFSLAVTF